MNNNSTLRVGVLLNGETLNRYAANAIEYMEKNTTAEVTLLVINSDKESKNNTTSGELCSKIKSGVRLLKAHGLWTPVVLRRALSPPKYAENININNIDCFSRAKKIYTTPISADGLGNELSESVVDEVANNTDIVVRFGFGIVKGKILTAPKYGVLSYHHADIRKYRGRAGGFWAYLNGDHEAGITLQQLSETLDGGGIVVYESVNIEDTYSFKEVRRQIHEESETMLAKAAMKIENNEFQPCRPDDLGPLYDNRNITHVSKFVIKRSKDIIRSLLK